MPYPSDTPNLADYIDHSLLDPTATLEQVDQLCRDADRYRFPSVCVLPCQVTRAVEQLHRSSARVSTVIGFPLGASVSKVKLYEAQVAAEGGAEELDVVINLSWLKSGQTDRVHAEIASIVEETGIPIKAILETGLLSNTEKQLAGEICADAGVAFLKTSTGWRGGATVDDVRLLWQISEGRVAVKASGGIKTVAAAIALIQAGATRLGTSRGIDLIHELETYGKQDT